jgi:hypothetical protein
MPGVAIGRPLDLLGVARWPPPATSGGGSMATLVVAPPQLPGGSLRATPGSTKSGSMATPDHRGWLRATPDQPKKV